MRIKLIPVLAAIIFVISVTRSVAVTTPTPPPNTPSSGEYMFTAVEDTHVKSAYPKKNYGSLVTLDASNYSASNTIITYLKFNLSTLAGKTISGAALKLKVTSSRVVDKDIKLVSSTSWTESNLTWGNRPPLGSLVGRLPSQSVTAGSVVTIPLDTALISPSLGDFLAIAIDNTSVNSSTFTVSSSEAPVVSDQPVLVVSVSSTLPTPTSTSYPPGDANFDGKVNESDYDIWKLNFNTTTSNGAASGDFNGDGKVDGLDYNIWIVNYSFPNTPTPTIKPTATPVTGSPTPKPSATPTPKQTISPTPTPMPTPSGGAPYRAFTNDSYWNTPMPIDAPIDPHNAEYINDANTRSSPNFIRLSGAPGHTDDWAYPIYWAKTTDKLYTVDGTNGPTVNVRIPSGATAMAGADGGIIIYDIASDQVVEFYQATYNSSTDTWGATTTKRYILSSNGLEGGVAGSNNPLNSGHRGQPPSERVIRRDEVASGQVRHRLECFWHDTGTNYANHYWPMSGDEGAKGGIVPEGIVLRLKWSVNVNDPIYHLSPAEKIIAKALQEYGCMIGDNEGGSANSTKLERGMSAWSALDPEMSHTALSVFTWDKFEFIQGGYDPVTRTVK